MTRTFAVVTILVLMLTGCLRGSRALEFAALLELAPDLMRETPAGAQLPPDRWPAELKALGPKRVYATQDGIYIVTSNFFVQEKGLFLPRSPAFVPRSGNDPEFGFIIDGLYSYELEG